MRGETDIVVVDNLERADKFLNLTDCEIADFIDKRDFLSRLEQEEIGPVRAIFHEGACSDTMEHNGRYMMANNYEYSKSLLHYCLKHSVSYLYASSASVYGGGRIFKEERQYEAPLNVYGYSKFLFDQYVRRMFPGAASQIAGFRYFNVYGPREQHKGRMASVALHCFNQYREQGYVNLFEGCDGYENGEQVRDFISVEDVVDVNLYFLDNPGVSGIFNVGTGRSQPFNDVAVAAVNTCRQQEGKEKQTLEDLLANGCIRYIDFPKALKGKYQSFTEADIGNIRSAGYSKSFYSVEEGVERYLRRLMKNT